MLPSSAVASRTVTSNIRIVSNWIGAAMDVYAACLTALASISAALAFSRFK